jgi:hypothetical protein
MRARPSVRQSCVAIAVVIGGASVIGAPAAAAACNGTPVAVNGYGVCVGSGQTTVPGQERWIPGVPSQSVNTPEVLFVPAQSFRTPYVPSQGVTVPPTTVQGVTVAPCTGSC